MSELTADNIDDLIEKTNNYRIRIDEECAHKGMYSNPAERMLKPLYIAKVYLERGHDVDWHTHGLIINDKFIIGYNARKWRVKGKSKWYWYTEKRFIEILENE